MKRWAAGIALAAATTSAWTLTQGKASTSSSRSPQAAAAAQSPSPARAAGRPRAHLADTLPGMPTVANPRDIYAADRAGALSPVVAGFRPLLYVPNSESSSVDEIDPITRAIVRHIPVGRNPQHVVPAWDLKTLWVLNDRSNSVTAIFNSAAAYGALTSGIWAVDSQHWGQNADFGLSCGR